MEDEGIPDEISPLFQVSQANGTGALRALPEEADRLLLTDSIRPRPLHKTLALLEQMARLRDAHYERLERLALARALVASISNLEFGPEVGVGPIKPSGEGYTRKAQP